MKFLRFTLFALTGLIVVAALAAPGLIGPKVEEIWQQQFTQLQGAENTSYERSWFGASVETRVSSEDGPTSLVSSVQHGPVLFTPAGPRVGLIYSETRLSLEQLAPSLRGQLESLYAGADGALSESPVVLESLVGADNQVVNRLRFKPFKRMGRGEQLEFGGAVVEMRTDYTGALLTGRVFVGRIQEQRAGLEVLSTEPVEGTFEVQPSSHAKLSLHLPILRAEPDSGPMELRDVSLQVDTKFLPGGNLQLDSELLAPEVQSATPITSVLQRLSLPSIRPADLVHYLRQLAPAAESGRNWPLTMSRPLQLQQQLAIESANGPILMDVDADWSGMPVGARPVRQGAGPWLKPLQGSMTISAAEKALLQSPLVGQTLTLRQYGLLLEQGDELQMHLEVDRGELRINGQLLPADLLLAALLGGFGR